MGITWEICVSSDQVIPCRTWECAAFPGLSGAFPWRRRGSASVEVVKPNNRWWYNGTFMDKNGIVIINYLDGVYKNWPAKNRWTNWDPQITQPPWFVFVFRLQNKLSQHWPFGHQIHHVKIYVPKKITHEHQFSRNPNRFQRSQTCHQASNWQMCRWLLISRPRPKNWGKMMVEAPKSVMRPEKTCIWLYILLPMNWTKITNPGYHRI